MTPPTLAAPAACDSSQLHTQLQQSQHELKQKTTPLKEVALHLPYPFPSSPLPSLQVPIAVRSADPIPDPRLHDFYFHLHPSDPWRLDFFRAHPEAFPMHRPCLYCGKFIGFVRPVLQPSIKVPSEWEQAGWGYCGVAMMLHFSKEHTQKAARVSLQKDECMTSGICIERMDEMDIERFLTLID